MFKKSWLVLALLLVAGLLLAACAPAAGEDAARLAALEDELAAKEAELEEAQAAEGTSEEELAALEAELAEKEAELAAAAEAAAAGEEEGEFPVYTVEFKNPDTLTHLVIGEPESLDNAVTYESSGMHLLRQMYDFLIFFEEGKIDSMVPMLATEWEVSDDGMTYTFKMREGVTFHEGGTLEPHDVAYTFHRNLLLGWDFLGAGGPMGLYFDPFFGTWGIGEAGDGGLLDMAGGDDMAVCEMVMDAVVADDDAGTVTMTLDYAAGYFPMLLAQGWAGIQDMEWMIDQGAWDGDCATWRDWYLPEVSESTLYEKVNGTGPYKLDSWTHGEEIVLKANQDWWVDEPLWEGSAVDGVPEIETIVYRKVEEWGTRLAAFEAGDADIIDHEMAFAAQIDPMVKEWVEYDTGETTIHNPDGILRMYHGLPGVVTADLFFNFNVQTEGGNPWIGSGELDGQGVPADFFSDIHVRKAFNYCFDRDTFIEEVRQGEGIPHRGPIISGMLGYESDSFIYDFDLDKCEEELALAWDGQLPETGFLITLVHNAGNDSRRIAMEILRDNVTSINENYQVVIASMPWPTYLAERRAGRFPVHLTGWIEDFHHPHNWVVPYATCNGDFSGRQYFPDDMCKPWDELVQEAVVLSTSDPDAAHELYKQLQAETMEQAIDIFIYQATLRRYEQLWVQGYYYHPMYDDPYYPALSKVAP
jgi:peptide/nickel transport system substrate-binding protein